MFSGVPPIPDFPKIEHKILRFWRENKSFEKLMEMRRGNKPYSFIDGPITANNPMGVHHAWGRTYKDLFQRFRAMQGYDLRYQNGFDCQGLWVEVEVEKELGFKSKKDIEAYGIAEFVKRCKQRVLRYAAKQTEQSIRLGYWMDWNDPGFLLWLADALENPSQIITIRGANGQIISDTVERIVGQLGSPEIGGSYFTFSDENNYMIWAFLKKCCEKGWIYKGTDVMPWCPRCSTALSEHEIVTEGYKELVHPGLTIKFPLKAGRNESLLVWTTTPWTLTSNVAVAVHPDITYVKVKCGSEYFYLGKPALDRTLPKGSYEIVGEMKGSDMEGWTYNGPFDELPAQINSGAVEAHRVILWSGVTEEEGTCIVHIAPGCGKEDFELGKIYGLPTIAPLDEFGVFIEGFGKYTGTHVYESAGSIIDDLKRKGLLLKVEDYRHRYPVCWRCGSELVFRLVDEWFISMGKKLNKPLEEITEEEKAQNLRYQIMEVAKKVRWIPDYGLQHEINWLENMEDWMISKKRYWGLALPIWECHRCGGFEVIGGREELKARAVEGWEIFEGHTPHRPWVDAVKIRCSRCGALMSRIPDVGNPWLDAGIVAYSTIRYSTDRNYWRKWFPAEFVCESLPGQFRNWFYAMLAMSTVMEGEPPFKICFGHGLVLDEQGREMHKSWGNVIWFDEAAEKMGADVMRWIYCTTRPEQNLLFGYKRAEEARKRFLIPLWNIYSFFVTYANLDEWSPKRDLAAYDSFSLLDKWAISKLNILIKDVTRYLEDFNPYDAAISIERFVDELSTWYIRRSRRRFWKSERDEDKNAAYTVLYICLTTLIKLLAPFIPFITEEIYQNIVRGVDPNAPESIHHNDWPIADERMIDEDLMRDMDLAIKICSLGRSARNKAGIKLRQPLLEAKVVVSEEVVKRIERLKGIIIDELNVKSLSLTTRRSDLFNYSVKIVPESIGRKYGRLLPKIREAVEKISVEEVVAAMKSGCLSLTVEGQEIRLLPEDIKILEEPKNGYSISEENNIVVGVCKIMPENLKLEGLARDIVRRIQNQRKEAGFNIADQIETYYEAGPILTEVFESFGDYISAETLSVIIRRGSPPGEAHLATYNLAGETLKIWLRRAG
ncbi:MAG: class I tRNA ligase family protein [Candidatus Bathyarchaeota archaeon]|nr:class I tRNA ligase family protein [Candidatus Bathyarchaeota archaeon]